MASTIILCFMLTIFSVLTINSFSSTRVAEQTSLNNVVDASMNAIQLDKQYNRENYEEVVNDLLQLVILQSASNGKIEVKILEANTQEGLLDIEVTKTYTWYGVKKDVVARRTVILEEFENPPAEATTVMFTFTDVNNQNIVWRDDATFVGAILKRPKNPKKTGYTFKGWTLDSSLNASTIISDDDWQNFIVPDTFDAGSGKQSGLIFYAVFEANTK